MLNFIQDLKENPNNLETWLVYANNLLSLGSPLGELIALEHRLTCTSPLEGSYRIRGVVQSERSES